jgi:menaquinone-dependent protoporphyrinogen IX oxidase
MIAILYATMTGNAEGCAIDLARHLKNGGLVCKLSWRTLLHTRLRHLARRR